MIKNYFKTAWRNLLRHKRVSLINMGGLSIGIAASLLLFLVVQFEWGFDRFQRNYDRIYRVVKEDRYETAVDYNPGVPDAVPEALKLDLPGLKKVAAVLEAEGQMDVYRQGDARPAKFTASNVFFISPDFFELFDAKWLAGSAALLDAPGNVVLGRSTAEKYYGSWKKAMNQRLTFSKEISLKVAGIVEDAPDNSNFPMKVLIPFASLQRYGRLFNHDPNDWNSTSSSFQTYVLLDPQEDLPKLTAQLGQFTKKHFEGLGISKKMLHFQPLKEIHFDQRYATFNQHQVRMSTLRTLSLIAVIIVLMACINFVNMSTAQAIGKSKEIGVRKVLGSSRGQLLGLSFAETAITVCFSLVVALMLAYACMPFMEHIANVPADMPLLNTRTGLFLAAVWIIATVLAGTYPALVTSGFKPIAALKNKIQVSQVGGVSLRRVLVVLQFAIAQLLMVGTFIAVRQMDFVRSADLGFSKDALYYVQVPSDDSVHQRMVAFKEELLRLPDVRSASLSADVPSSANNWSSNFYFNHSEEDVPFATSLKFADADYFGNYGMNFAAGRGYVPRDTMYEAVINETMRKKLGLKSAQEALGKTVRIGASGPWMPITGVVKDFSANSLRDESKPLILCSRKEDYYLVGLKLAAGAGSQTMDKIKGIYDRLYPDDLYAGNFLDESIAEFYRQDNQLALVYKIFAVLAIVISAIGLYGLISFMTEQKVKEIGIRKVLGASVQGIVFLLSREFVWMVLLAFIIASPLAYYLMQQWLADFAHKAPISGLIFLLSLGLSLLLMALTVGFKALKAALANPVNSLRDE